MNNGRHRERLTGIGLGAGAVGASVGSSVGLQMSSLLHLSSASILPSTTNLAQQSSKLSK